MASVALLCMLTLGLCCTSVAAETTADRFVATLASDTTIPAEVRELIRTTWTRCEDCDGAEFLTQGLAVLSERFREGLDAYDADEYAHCGRIMRGLHADTNPFVAVNSAAYEIKALVALERLLEAGERIAELTGEQGGPLEQYSYFAAEMDFLRGYCLLADLQYDAAANALQDFVKAYPDASPRLAVSAMQMLNELANRVSEGIGEVADLMSFSQRRLKAGATDEPMQTRQQRIVELLDALVEEAESQEQSGAGGGGGGSGSPGSKSPSNPMSESRLPGGTSKQGSLREQRRASPGDLWGSMPPAQREQVLQALRDSFPSRYRQLVEQYYEELAKKP